MGTLEIQNCRGNGHRDDFSKMLLQDWATLTFQMSFTILERMEEGSGKRVERETRRGRSGGEKKKEAEGKMWEKKRWLKECLKKDNTPSRMV